MYQNSAPIIQYTPAQLYSGKEWYIGFTAWDPAKGEMRRKRIKLNRIKGINNRKKYAQDLIREINNRLRSGWNPWIAQDNAKSYVEFETAVDNWMIWQEKSYDIGDIREATIVEYRSKIKNLLQYNRKLPQPIHYIYQMDGRYLNDFLEHIYIDRGNSAKTHNNYIRVISVMCKHLLQHDYIKTDPSATLRAIGRRSMRNKEREVITDRDMRTLRDHLLINNKHYLLACYLEYYCFIRPKELSMLRVGYISYKRQTIYIPGTIAKNRKNAVVTMPQQVIELMIELGIHNYPDQFILFSDGFVPGESMRSEKAFRDYWIKLRKKLRFPDTYVFYSLKDTGVTAMLRANIDPVSVRDQARHSSISITDIYTPHDVKKANPELQNYRGDF